MSEPLEVWTMNGSKYYIQELRLGNQPVQWSVPENVRVLIRPNANNANEVFIASSAQGPAVFHLAAPVGGIGKADEIILTNGAGPLPLFFSGTATESVAIWTMPRCC